MDRNFGLEIAKVIGEPINIQLPVSPLVKEMAQFEVAEPGEDVKYYTSEDSGTDHIYTVDANGAVTQVKVTPNTPAALTFAGLQSAQEFVLLHEVLNSLDVNAFARRREAIGRSMDKKEAAELFALILAASAQEVTQGSGEDIYDVIEAMVAKIEDYGDDMILYCGSTVYRNIRKYLKAKASTFNYAVDIVKDMKEKFGINQVVKVIGSYIVDSGSSTLVLAVDKAVLVARTSTIANGKPLAFVRRRITPELAAIAGLTVEQQAQRAIVTTPTPLPTVVAGRVVSGYGVWGYEDKIAALLNSRAVCWATIA